jgi:crotonobetainyl-CoA:carnitine CoA-transferase CaiB-like acyl-CoA transferase
VAGSFRLTKTADGFVSVVTLTDKQWQGMVEAAGIAGDDRAASVEGRMKHGGETMRAVKIALADMTTDEVVARMLAHEVPCAPVVALSDVRAHPQVVASGTIEEVDHPALGRIAQPRPAARMAGITEAVRTPAPGPGEHTDEILAEAGYSAAEITGLRQRAVVA